jgi:hypothetical protein
MKAKEYKFEIADKCLQKVKREAKDDAMMVDCITEALDDFSAFQLKELQAEVKDYIREESEGDYRQGLNSGLIIAINLLKAKLNG